ncbi:hypothetical protein DPMN_152471 [Dreissena polymorpha]|uniref:NACHT domain-containing protein n=1 Tax=Dreissena polymorpha TaxID=45954 RepID=A0A9D4FKG3_DREPO|nr:hypothetical protein DPMN_152471 [Dreissena polymorpha]
MTCLSSSWVSPPPPDKQCPLEKVRQIGRDVRHTSDCKVTDADLQDYLRTLSALLADPQYLQHDPSAAIAFARLSDVQNDCISIEELGDLLKEVYETLENAQEVVERFSEEAERTLSNALQKLDATILFGKKRLERETQVGEQRIKIKTNVGKQRLERKTKFWEQHLERKTKDGEQFIESKVQDGIVRLEQTANKTAQAAYERAVADLRRRLVDHYHDNASNVPLSVLDQSLDKRIADIYATPKIHRIEITKDGKRVKKEQVLAYKELFCSDDSKSNRRLYVQGEPGSGKSTFAAKLVHVWCDGYRPSTAAPNVNESFDDVLIIQKFQFVFYIALRESRGTKDLTHMVKKQLIDTLYSDEKRDAMYKLLLQIIETEVCLVVRDGLDEWVAPDGSNLAEPSMAGFPNDKCTVLTTSRPWKLAEERIKNSQIDILVEIEGINDPNTFCERVLRCILDESKNLKTTAFEIRRFISDRKLTSLSYSPMLYTLVICTWTDTLEDMEHLKGFSLCALYTSLLESLCKKTSDIIGFFNDLNPPQVKCFSRSRYLRPIIQKVDVISKAAFHLLFSPEKEQSIVFNDHELSNYLTQSEQEFALKAGLISKRKTKKTFNSSISFLHKSIQEFLAAYHIALNAHLIDDVIFGYVGRHSNAYLDISQVFIFLCGLNISAANKLSGMMNEHNNKWHDYRSWFKSTFQSIIEAGYTEAVSNDQTDILLRLDQLEIHEDNLMDMYNIWRENKSNVLRLGIHVGDKTYRDIHSSSTHSEATSQVEFDLSSCIKLKYLTLSGSGMQIKDSSSSVSSTLPVCIVLNSENPAQCADPPPVLPCIEHIELKIITCSSTWLRSRLSTLLTLGHVVYCELTKCYITSCKSDAVPWTDTATNVTLMCFKNALKLVIIEGWYVSRSLWEALHGLNIKSLSLKVAYGSVNVNYPDSMSQSLSSLTHLDTLSIEVNDDSPGLWEALHGLNIKSLSLNGAYGSLNVNYADSMSQSLSSLTHLDTLSIEVDDDSPGLWEALRGLNIKSLSLRRRYSVLNVNYADSMSMSLSSLTYLDKLSIKVNHDSPGLWAAIRGLNIKSLSLSVEYVGLNIDYADSMSLSLSSLTHLDTLSIYTDGISSGLWKALHGLNINSLSISDGFFYDDDDDSIAQSLSSLKQLETLSIYFYSIYFDIWLPQSLKHLNSYCMQLLPSELRELVDALSACTQTIESNLDFCCASMDDSTLKRIPPEEYIVVKKELEMRKNVAVKRFRIYDRICKTYRYDHDHDDDATSHWSVRDMCGVHDDNPDDDTVKDEAYKRFVRAISNEIINRISMRLLITPSSNS